MASPSHRSAASACPLLVKRRRRGIDRVIGLGNAHLGNIARTAQMIEGGGKRRVFIPALLTSPVLATPSFIRLRASR